ncbi:hypothetical protein BaRGS_00005989 [Batillaria attramentaria]|uniref:Uncharacterized protein n=1 Tax=Batillaria attramentaria TaxID=370345 RepID=A0ABD0LT53_9CAEN
MSRHRPALPPREVDMFWTSTSPVPGVTMSRKNSPCIYMLTCTSILRSADTKKHSSPFEGVQMSRTVPQHKDHENGHLNLKRRAYVEDTPISITRSADVKAAPIHHLFFTLRKTHIPPLNPRALKGVHYFCHNFFQENTHLHFKKSIIADKKTSISISRSA